MNGAHPFETFVRAHQNMVFATAYRLLGNAADAEDVAQTVFLKAFERFDSIGTSPRAAGWLRTVATHECLNRLTRYRKRWRLFSEMRRDDGKGTQSTFEDSIPSGETPALEFERADRRHRLESALGSLPDHQRVPLVLFHIEEKTYEEIAALLGVSLGKVKTDIHRGRATLKQQLQ